MTTHWKSGLGVLVLAGAAGAAERSLPFKVDGWHSKGDAFKAETVVRAVKGVKSATADFASKQLTVVFDDAAASEAQVRKAIADAGFKVP